MELEGTRIGPYLLNSRIAAGGMGEVYQAHDTRLDRLVAIKVLPADAADPESCERFDREGRIIAGLNHPNICVLHDVGQTTVADSSRETIVRFLVMELLAGETLASRLARGPIPLNESLRIATGIAAALDTAHRAGIVHRDVKPGNVMLTKSGVKVLDFGIAKAMLGSADDLTTTGALVGTVAYMAPEQLAAAPVDQRTDVYAFGIVLFEMLAGVRPHKNGASLPSVPPAVERLILKCLAPDPDQRWQTAADLKSELEWIASDPGPRAAPRRFVSTARVAWATAVAVAVVAAATMLGVPRRAATNAAPRHLSVELPVAVARLSELALAPDGSSLVYVDANAGKAVLRRRDLSNGTTIDLASGSARGFGFGLQFSPDGLWVTFVDSGKLKKVRSSGGSPVTICDVVSIEGVSWGPDGQIVYASVGRLWRVDAGGGALPQPLAVLQPDEAAVYPHVLAHGESLLVTILGASGLADDAWLEVISIRDGTRRKLVRGAVGAVNVGGFLVFSRQSDIIAMNFDPNRMTVSGSPATMVRGVHTWGRFARPVFTVANDGTLVYFHSANRGSTIVRVSKSGDTAIVPLPPRNYAHLNLLPDGRSLVLEIEDAPHQLFRYDFRNQALTQLTHDSSNHRAVLSPDGRSMIFSSDRTVPRNLFRQATDGSGAAKRITNAAYVQNASAWSADGRRLVFTENRPDTRGDIWVMSLYGEPNLLPFARTRFQEQGGTLSPDGHWMAYASNESGRLEVLIAAFPGPGPRTQVSIEGGDMPVFSGDGSHLYFRLNDQILVADLTYEPHLSASRPRIAFDMPDAEETQVLPFPITAAGDALYYTRVLPGTNSVTVILNWFSQVRAAVGTR